ncbi:MAG: hypothetical protein H0X43_02275 [Nitrosospira sp.]|nr:hypothetical protein [Nitrosospira sp.]
MAFSLSFNLGRALAIASLGVAFMPALSHAVEIAGPVSASREMTVPSSLIYARGILLQVGQDKGVSKGDAVEFFFEKSDPDYPVVKLQKLAPIRGSQ